MDFLICIGLFFAGMVIGTCIFAACESIAIRLNSRCQSRSHYRTR